MKLIGWYMTFPRPLEWSFASGSEPYLMLLRRHVPTYTYSPSHIAQITDFLDFLHAFCEEKSETFTEF